MQSWYRGGGSCGAEAVRPGRGTAGVPAAVAAGSSRRTWTQRRRLPGRKAQRGPDVGECRGQRPRGVCNQTTGSFQNQCHYFPSSPNRSRITRPPLTVVFPHGSAVPEKPSGDLCLESISIHQYLWSFCSVPTLIEETAAPSF